MLVVYDTLTGNTRKFVNKLPQQFKCCHTSEYDGTTPFILATYTINFGNISETTERFLEIHHNKMIGVASGGNRNWGQLFAKAADIISSKYRVPIIAKFELQGTRKDIENFLEGVEGIVEVG